MPATANTAWPSVPLEGPEGWADTQATLHLWTQVVGKIRMACSPWTNHGWHVPLYVTPRGLTTGTVHHERAGVAFSMEFELVGSEGRGDADHALVVRVSDGRGERLALRAETVADFHARVMATLDGLGLPVRIRTQPSEIAGSIPFERDREHASYDADAAHRFWRALLGSERVFQRFRAGFAGKCSPVHFFWGAFDLAVTRFSGRPAPPHPGGAPHFPDWAAREAYSHEVSSAGFWPGQGLGEAAFYSYAYPAPEGFERAAVRPAEARWSAELGEFLLPYEAVRGADDPDGTLLEFLESTYAAAADLAGWDRAALDYVPPPQARVG